MSKWFPRGNSGDEAAIPFFVSNITKESNDGKVKDGQQATAALQSQGNQTTNGESKSNFSRVRHWEPSYATWSSRNWKDLHQSLSGIRRSPREE